MSTTTFANAPVTRTAEGPWAVETHGLTKRFGENVAVG
jgi:hypothetical protein